MESSPAEAPLETVYVDPAAPPAAPEPRPPRVWTALLAVVAYAAGSVAVAAGFVLVFALLGARHGRGAPAPQELAALALSPGFLLAVALAQCGVGAGIALAGAQLSPEPLRTRLALGRARLGTGTLLVACLGILLAGSILPEVVELLDIPVTGALVLLGRTFRGLSPATFAAAILVVGVAVPIGEELFFRGYVQSRLCRRWGAWPGIVAAALVFAAAHLDPFQSPFAFVAGLYLGWLAQRTGSIVPSMIVHGVNNSVATTLAWALPDASPSRAAHAAILAAYVAGAIAAVAWLTPRLSRRDDAGPPPAPGPETATPPSPEG